MITSNSTIFLHQDDPRVVIIPTEDSLEALVGYNFDSQQIKKRSFVKDRNDWGISDEEFIQAFEGGHLSGWGHEYFLLVFLAF